MREIKFRGKRTYNREWVYGNLIILPNGERYIVNTNYFELDGHHLACDSDTPVFTIQETVGQFIELYDEGGIEVYDGDIIENEYEEVATVYYDEEDAMFCINLGNVILNFSHENSKWWKIIGNIHDNPELVEVQE